MSRAASRPFPCTQTDHSHAQSPVYAVRGIGAESLRFVHVVGQAARGLRQLTPGTPTSNSSRTGLSLPHSFMHDHEHKKDEMVAGKLFGTFKSSVHRAPVSQSASCWPVQIQTPSQIHMFPRHTRTEMQTCLRMSIWSPTMLTGVRNL